MAAGGPAGRGAEGFWGDAVKQDELGEPPTTDIAAALTVIKRRGERSRELERINDWRLDLSGSVLPRANLSRAHFAKANLLGAHLERAYLSEAYLQGAILMDAHLQGATLIGAHLEWAILKAARLEGANLVGAYLEGTSLLDTHLERANLDGTQGLSKAMLLFAHGDAATKVPAEIRPAHWPPSLTA